MSQGKLSSGLKFIKKSCCIHYCRHDVYHNKTRSVDLEKFPPISASITFKNRRAYLQTYLWYHRAFAESVDIKPEDFGCLRNDNKHLFPQITNNSLIPESFIYPSSCLKRARKSFWMSENVYYVLQVLQMWC